MNERFHRRAFGVRPLDTELCVVSLPDGAGTARVSKRVAELVATAPAVGTLDDYVGYLAAKAQIPQGSRSELIRAFAELVEQGLFVSSSKLTRSLSSLAAAHLAGSSERTEPQAGSGTRINSLVTLTRNRPAALERSLRSYAEHARHAGRSLTIAVVDGSDAEHQRLNEACLAKLERDLDVAVGYASTAEKASFAAALAQESGVEPALVEFALFDGEHTGNDTGANRNALLLAHVGSVFWSNDDDTVCTLAEPSESSAGGLKLTSEYDPTRVRLLGGLAADHLPFKESQDCLWDAHEQFTGQSVAACVARRPADSVSVQELGGEGLERLLTGSPKIAGSMSGFVGDCGSSSPAFHLWRAEIPQQLPSTRAAYEKVALERRVLRAADTATISSGSFLMTTAYSFDATELAPPFLPVMRGEDQVFGTVLRRCFPDRFLAYLPCCVAHLPVENRQQAQTRLWDRRRTVSFLRTVQTAVGLCDLRTAAAGAPRLQLLGRQLRGLAELPWPELELTLHRRISRDIERQCARYERQCAERDAGNPWAEDLARYSEDLQAVVGEPDALVPLSLRRGRSIEQARALVQRLLRGFGELMMAWPNLVQGASRLRDRGLHLTRPPLLA